MADAAVDCFEEAGEGLQEEEGDHLGVVCQFVDYGGHQVEPVLLEEDLGHMVLQHLFGLFFGAFVLEMVLDELSIFLEESLQPAVVSPDGVAGVEHLIVGLEISLPAAPILNGLCVANNTKVLEISWPLPLRSYR